MTFKYIEQSNANGSEATSTEKKEEKTDPEPEKKEIATADKIYDVTDMIREAQENGAGLVNAEDFEVVESNDTRLLYNFDKFVTTLDKTIVLRPKQSVGDKYDNRVNEYYAVSARALMEQALKKEGFSRSEEIDDTDEPGVVYRYFMNEDGYACEADAFRWVLTCGHESWISEERLNLLTNLADAYNEKNNDSNILYISAKIEDIKDSATEPYQVIKAKGRGSYNLWFYRKGKDGSWEFVASGPNNITCRRFEKTDDVKKAFNGIDTGCVER